MQSVGIKPHLDTNLYLNHLDIFPSFILNAYYSMLIP